MKHDWTNPEYANLRALDAEIALTIGGWAINRVYTGEYKTLWCSDEKLDGQMLLYAIRSEEIPHYTTSVDAALTLVPDDVLCDLHEGLLFHRAVLTNRSALKVSPYLRRVITADADTRALAICQAVQVWYSQKIQKS